MHQCVSRRFFSQKGIAVLRYIVIGTLVLFSVVIQVFGQATQFGVQFNERGLQALSYISPSGRLVLRHPASGAHSDINVKRDVLVYAFYGPADSDIRLSVTPRELTNQCRIQRSGSFGGAPVYIVIVDPATVLPGGHLAITDSFSLRIHWDEALTQAISAIPPTSAPFLNPTWRAKTRIAQKNTIETAQDNVSPNVWYDRFADYKRIHTSNDGIAYIQGSEAFSDAGGVPLENVVLFWRGIEQPIYIDDTDASGSFTGADRVYFRGRRASGDSTWLDTHDSTSVFYISVKGASGQRRRMLPLNLAAGATDTVASVIVRQRFEVDTGYFHPGSGIDDDHSIFESSLVPLEGFYWRSLYGRGKEFKETSPVFPMSPYAWSKYMVERYCASLIDVPIKLFRYFNVYSTEGESESHKVGQCSPYYKFRKQAEKNGVIELFIDPDNRTSYRDFIHVNEVLDYHEKFLHSEASGVFNIGTGKCKTFEDVAHEVAEQYNAKIKEIPMPVDISTYIQWYTCADMTKTKTTLNLL